MKNLQASDGLNSHRSNISKTSRGFTMIEMLIALGIIGVVMGGVLSILMQSQSSYQMQTVQAEHAQQLRIALDQISRALRQAGNDPLKALTVPPVVPGQNSLTINADITGSVPSVTSNPMERTGDPDGLLTSIYETVQVSYNPWSKQVLCDVGYGTQVVAEDVESLTFRYYDITGTETTNPPNIARVKVRMVGRSSYQDNQSGESPTMTLESDIFIRSQAPEIFTEPNLAG